MKEHSKTSANYFYWAAYKKYSLTMLLFLFLINTGTVSAQLTIQDVNITMIPNSNALTDGVCQLTISDTTNCSFVAVELSEGVTDSLVLFREFAFDQTTGLPGSLSWSRNGNVISLGLGEFSPHAVWKARVRLKNTSGNWSDWEEFIFN